MAKIINFQKYQTRVVEQRGFNPWLKRFGESYGQTTRLSDISDRTLYFLAVPGELSNVAFYELIMGILDLGEASEFHNIDRDKQMQVMDIHLFLVDIVRFEMMHRLGWIDKLPCEGYSLLEMVQDFDKLKLKCKGKPPELLENHPDYHAYRELTRKDKESFIRRLLNNALETFNKKIEY